MRQKQTRVEEFTAVLALETRAVLDTLLEILKLLLLFFSLLSPHFYLLQSHCKVLVSLY